MTDSIPEILGPMFPPYIDIPELNEGLEKVSERQVNSDCLLLFCSLLVPVCVLSGKLEGFIRNKVVSTRRRLPSFLINKGSFRSVEEGD